MSNDTQPEIRFPGFTDDWEERKLGDETKILAGGDVDKTKLKENGKYPVLANALTNDGIVGYYDDDFRIKAPAVTVTGRGDVGYAQARRVNFTPVVRLLSVKSKHDVDFLENSINNHKVLVESTGVPQLTAPQLGNYKIFFPTIEEETKIGSLFKKLDTAINIHQRELDLLKETKKGFLQKMFPKNGAKVPEIRFPGFTGDWEERKLGSIYDFSKGKGLPLNSFTYSKDDPAIAYGHLYTKYSEVISEVYLSSDDDGVLSKDNDLLFPGSSTVPNGTAQANAIMLNNVKLGGDIIIARPKQDTRVLSIFMSYQINSQRQKLFPITVGTTITHMYGKDLSKVKFFITNYSEQQKIGAFFKQLDDTIALHQRKLDLLKETKKGFLQKMFV
ncbi:restriction endonuclease subunit S [Enterococcus faecium]|uniref:restriction endonuclease subunit S n=1 Tax=Enterococcus faecium TaxID=1352 RepID=UPI001E4953D7|nr:restriction endonuclease subunit S [Enterococcus faecium]MCD5088231.1 restriction endonuclease subunit S [Enterococcus faecium]